MTPGESMFVLGVVLGAYGVLLIGLVALWLVEVTRGLCAVRRYDDELARAQRRWRQHEYDNEGGER